MHHGHASDRRLWLNGKVCHGTVSELASIVVIQPTNTNSLFGIVAKNRHAHQFRR
jgi:hypothetical protein